MKHYDLKSLESDEEKMRLIALFIPAIISLGIKYRKNREKKWEYFDFICTLDDGSKQNVNIICISIG